MNEHVITPDATVTIKKLIVDGVDKASFIVSPPKQIDISNDDHLANLIELCLKKLKLRVEFPVLPCSSRGGTRPPGPTLEDFKSLNKVSEIRISWVDSYDRTVNFGF